MAFSRSFYKKTEDDWYPSYQCIYGTRILSFVQVGYSQNPIGKIVISVYGADDIGMSIEPKTIEEAEKVIEKIISQEFINKDFFDGLGFEVY